MFIKKIILSESEHYCDDGWKAFVVHALNTSAVKHYESFGGPVISQGSSSARPLWKPSSLHPTSPSQRWQGLSLSSCPPPPPSAPPPGGSASSCFSPVSSSWHLLLFSSGLKYSLSSHSCKSKQNLQITFTKTLNRTFTKVSHLIKIVGLTFTS